MSIEIREVTKKRELNKLINLPWKLYKNDPKWVPPLKLAQKEMFSPKHPFYETATIKTFYAIEEKEILGRIVAVVNKAYNDYHNDKCGFWGFFEAIPSQEVAHSLLEKAESWFKEQGMTKSIGPVNPSTNYECGLLIEGFDDPPQLMMTYNPPNYKTMIENAGYSKATDLLAYLLPTDFTMPEKINKIAAHTEKKARVTYRPISKKNWDADVALMLEIYNSAWEKNWGFVPMTEREFIHTAKDLKSVVDENLIIFAEVDKKAAGFIVALPDYNQIFKTIKSGRLFPTGLFKLLTGKKKITRCRVITMGVKEEYRKIGLASLLYKKAHEEIIKIGYNEIEMSWILEDNLNMNRPLIVMGANPYKKYRIFEKKL
jgi:GNAT superfamily N-acetyltransferase